MPISVVVAGAALALVPGAAGAAPATVLKVRSCETGDSAKERTAVFYARMRAVPGTSRMQMRFTLIDRSSDRETVKAPELTRWRRSRIGVRSFGYAQRVAGLQPGGAYAMLVDYRWVSATGKTIKSQRRTSADCRQDGKLPTVAVTGISAKPGDAHGTSEYDVAITNRGAVAARAVIVHLLVDGAAADAAEIDVLKPGETVSVRISGPRCVRRVRALVDRADSIHETTEGDNVLASRCPAPPG